MGTYIYHITAPKRELELMTGEIVNARGLKYSYKQSSSWNNPDYDRMVNQRAASAERSWNMHGRPEWVLWTDDVKKPNAFAGIIVAYKWTGGYEYNDASALPISECKYFMEVKRGRKTVLTEVSADQANAWVQDYIEKKIADGEMNRTYFEEPLASMEPLDAYRTVLSQTAESGAKYPALATQGMVA